MLKHSTFFDDQVHSISFERNNLRAAIAVIEAGKHRFETVVAERITIVSGEIRARIAKGDWHNYPRGTSFEIPATSEVYMEPAGGPGALLCEYIG